MALKPIAVNLASLIFATFAAAVAVLIAAPTLFTSAQTGHHELTTVPTFVASFRLQLIRGSSPQIVDLILSDVVPTPFMLLHFSYQQKAYMAAQFGRGAIPVMVNTNASSTVSVYYNPFCDIAMIVSFQAKTHDLEDLFVINGESLELALEQEHDAEPSRPRGLVPVDLYRRTARRTRQSHDLWRKANSAEKAKAALLSVNDQEQMSESFFTSFVGLARITDAEKAGLREFLDRVKAGGTAGNPNTQPLREKTLAVELSRGLPVFALGTPAHRVIYLASAGTPGRYVRIEMSLSAGSAQVVDAILVDAMGSGRGN